MCIGDDRARFLAYGLARQPGWAGRPEPTNLLTECVGPTVAAATGPGAAGLSSLADEQALLATFRPLADAPYLRLAGSSDSGRVVDFSPNDPRSVPLWRRLYPDAYVVAVDTDVAEADLTLSEPDVEAVLASVPQVASAISAPSPVTHKPDASPLAGRVVIVLGSGRSGTTWLHRMLTAHPACTGTESGETWLFDNFGRYWDQARNPAALGAWLPEAHLLGLLRRACDEVLLHARQRMDAHATYIVEKTPVHVWRLPMLSELYPDAAYIHVLRDGRDVALSYSRVPDGMSARAASETWAAAVKAVRAAAPTLQRFTEIRYEDLLRDPVAQTTRLARWLGIDADESFRREVTRRAQQRVSPLPSQGRVGAGKWREMSWRSRRAVSAAAEELLGELGYL